MSVKVKVEGEVVVRDGTKVAIEFYEEEFVISDDCKTLAQARSVIQAGLINERLRKKVSNFKRVRTCQVTSFANSGEKPECTELDKALIEATSLGCMPDNIDRYKRPDYELKAIQNAIDEFKKRKLQKKKAILEMEEEAV